MAFVNLSLLAGGLLVSIPVVLHLVMRQQPKQLVFPALRFLVQRKESNRRQLRLRQWILLLLRGLLIAVMAIALARPSTASAVMGNWTMIGALAAGLVGVASMAIASYVYDKGIVWISSLATGSAVLLVITLVLLFRTLSIVDAGMIGDPRAPVGAVFVVDTSPRMEYRKENTTRLEKAKRMAVDLLQQFPPNSEVAVLDSRPGGAAFSVDLAGAQSSLNRLQTFGVPRPLPRLIEDAMQLADTTQKMRKEVYVFTDMSRFAWSDSNADSLTKTLKKLEDVALYVIDVGSKDSQNCGLGVPQLAAETMARNTPLQIRVNVSRLGPRTTRVVQLYIEEPDPKLPISQDGEILLPKERLRHEQTVELDADSTSLLEFRVGGLPPGVHHGRLQLVGQDGLTIDNHRFFAVSVKDAWPLLVVSPANVTSTMFTEAIAPLEFLKTDRTRFECSVVSQPDLPNQNLEDFVAVCLLDPQPMPAVLWERIAQYVRQGGSLAVFLGHNARPVKSFNQPSAQQLLGGRLARQWRSPGRELFLAPRSFDHPVMAAFRDVSTNTPWRYFPVFRHWVLEEVDPESRQILHYSNNHPCLLENSVGQGNVLVMTTPVSDAARPIGRAAWNELPTGENPWPYFVLVNELMRYLADNEGQRLNHLTGDLVLLPNSDERDPSRYQMFAPSDEPQDIQAYNGAISVRYTEVPGAYRLKGNRGGPVIRGFSINYPSSAGDMTRLAATQLDDILGAERYRLANGPEQLQPIVGDVRTGKEFFPFLMVMLAVIFALETALANRFYRRQNQQADTTVSLRRATV